MGIIKGTLKVGALVGTGYVGKKIYDRYRENNPDGVGDVNGDGTVDYKDTASEIVRAAEEVLGEVGGKAKEKGGEAVKVAGQVIVDVSEKIREKIGNI